ncbi:carbohydrate ABC transporter permease [Kribbella sp. NPDC051586]|uniref:carbohydrate ABC transporter permease n=1 Tax=Kribbella sp. NPDC051586 TaxID=3364118 RepID=UPI0037B57753
MTSAGEAITTPRRTTDVRRRHISEHKLAPLVLVTPALLVIVGLRIVPLILGAQYSLTGDGARNGVFVGLSNYRALAHDPVFRTAIKNVGLLFLALPVAVAVPGILATFLFLKTPGHRFYRSVYFFPVVLSPVIIGAIFNILLSYDGPLNQGLTKLGIGPVDWLGNSHVAIFSVIGVHIWATFGMALVIFMAGFSTLDQSLLDAAKCDGANLPQTIRHVIVPELSRTIQFVFVTTMIGMLTGMFGLVYVMTAGGPGGATYLPEFYIWITQGQMNSPALASAASMVLFVLMLVVGLAQIRLIKRATKGV